MEEVAQSKGRQPASLCMCSKLSQRDNCLSLAFSLFYSLTFHLALSLSLALLVSLALCASFLSLLCASLVKIVVVFVIGASYKNILPPNRMAKAASLCAGHPLWPLCVCLHVDKCVCAFRVRVSVRKLLAKHFFGCMPLVTVDLRKLLACFAAASASSAASARLLRSKLKARVHVAYV